MSIASPEIPHQLQVLREESAVVWARRDADNIDREDFVDVPEMIFQDLRGLAGRVEAPTDCPEWCNDHLTYFALDPDEDTSLCSLHVEGEGWSLDVMATNEDGLTFMPADANELSLEQARAYAAAILSARAARWPSGSGGLLAPGQAPRAPARAARPAPAPW